MPIIHIKCNEKLRWNTEKSLKNKQLLLMTEEINLCILRDSLKPIFILFIDQCNSPNSSNAVNGKYNSSSCCCCDSQEFGHNPLEIEKNQHFIAIINKVENIRMMINIARCLGM